MNRSIHELAQTSPIQGKDDKAAQGDVIWAANRGHAWWPSKVLRLEEVSPHMLQLPHEEGDIPVILFGSSDVVWKKRTDVVAFDNHSPDRGSLNKMVFIRAFNEAKEEHFKAMEAKQHVAGPASSVLTEGPARGHIDIPRKQQKSWRTQRSGLKMQRHQGDATESVQTEEEALHTEGRCHSRSSAVEGSPKEATVGGSTEEYNAEGQSTSLVDYVQRKAPQYGETCPCEQTIHVRDGGKPATGMVGHSQEDTVPSAAEDTIVGQAAACSRAPVKTPVGENDCWDMVLEVLLAGRKRCSEKGQGSGHHAIDQEDDDDFMPTVTKPRLSLLLNTWVC